MLTVLVPWLEGGGAQQSLRALVERLDEPPRLVILFAGSRNHSAVMEACAEVVEFGYPRSAAGALRAAARLNRSGYLDGHVYSLMRGSHVALGLVPRLERLRGRLILSFHMLPSDEGSGPSAWLEDRAVLRAARRASLIAAPSRRAVDELRAMPALRDRRIEYSPNLIPDRGLSRPVVPARPGPRQEIRLAFLGRLERQKGLDTVPELLRAADAPAVHLRAAGDGPELHDLRRRLADVPAPHRVELIGRTEEVAELLDWADAVFLPSRAELNPVVVHEAWARHRPAITTDLPVFRDLATHGPILTFDDSSSLAERLRQVATGRSFAFPTADESDHPLLAELVKAA